MRESTEGTGPASWISSVTVGKPTALWDLGNRGGGDILVNGKPFDIDWFIDANAASGAFSRGSGTGGLRLGKITLEWKNMILGQSQTYYLPYQDPGEVEVGAALGRGNRYRDILTERWFKEYCPCEE